MAQSVGGVKGFFLRAQKSFYAGGAFAKDWSWWLAQKGGKVGLFLASTSMVVLMPLIFEINREVQVGVPWIFGKKAAFTISVAARENVLVLHVPLVVHVPPNIR